jgi:nucleoside-diphosphate-sugar epimerase
MTDETVLITGATGFIAGHCIEDLLRHGYRVRGTVRDLTRARVDHLHEIARATGGDLEFVEADLGADRGWRDAVAGCDYVWHVASPAPKSAPRHADEVVRPAVDGTLRVLRAARASGTVRRVVLTSSIDAVRSGYGRRELRHRDESDWSRPEQSDAYARSKTLAERAAWDLVREGSSDLELVSINPGLVLGPLQPGNAQANVSVEVIRLLLARKLPLVPRLGFAVVDVRDVAIAHRLAMLSPIAAGNRYILAGEPMWYPEIATLLHRELGPRGFRIPTRPMPRWLMWTVGRFDRTVRTALPYVDVPALVSSDKASRDLGWLARPAQLSIMDTAERLIELGLAR